MKKQTRFILFAFLVALLLVVTAIAASATVHEVDTKAELQTALDNVVDGDEIVVIKSFSFTGSVTFSKTATYTLRGSSSSVTVTLESGSFTINAGNVTIKNMKVVASAKSALVIKNAAADVTIGEAGGSNASTYIESKGSGVGTSSSGTGSAFLLEKGKLTIKSGTFYGSNRAANLCTLVIDGGNFYQNKTAVSNKTENAHILCSNSNGGTITINGGSFTRDSSAPYTCAVLFLDSNSNKSNVTITGGTFNNLTTGISIDRCNNLTITGGTFTSTASDAGNCALIYYNKTKESNSSGTVTVSGGTFKGTIAGAPTPLVYATAGNFIFSGGTFTTKGSVIFDIALSKQAGDSFEISGGTYILEHITSGNKGGVILRTRVGATFEVLESSYADVTQMFYMTDVDIKLSGGMLIDQRTTTSPLVDTTVSNSKVVIGNVALLTRYAKSYMVEVNGECDGVGESIPFAKNTVVIRYNGSNYYCYRSYQENGDTTYAPVMDEGASVALVDNQPGLLFFSTIPSSVVTALAQKSYTFGTLIAPADYVAAAGGFTHAKLKTWGEAAGVSPYYADIPAQNSVVHQQDGSIAFNGGLIYLKSCERGYAAVAYVCVDDTYYYSTYEVTENARTMAQVSKDAYTDYSLVQNGNYVFASKYYPGAYSEYSEAEQNLLGQYSNYTQTLTTATGLKPATSVSFSGTGGTNMKNKAMTLITQTLANYGYGASGTSVVVGSKGSVAKQALAKVEGYGYYIGVIGEQIVIAGSNDALIMQALDAFEAICKAANGAAFDLTEIIVSNVQMTTLNVETPFVYSHTRYAGAYNLLPQYITSTAKHDDAFSSIKFASSGKHLYNLEANEWTLVDAPLFMAKQIGEQIVGSAYNCIYVPDSLAVSGSAIHVGLTDLARELLLANGKDVGYYGYFIKDGNVVITSYDDATLRLAKSLFLENLNDFALDVNGDGTADVYAIPAGFEFENGNSNGFTGAFDSVSSATGTGNVASEVKQLITDYPRPDDLALSGAVNVSNSELELYYLNATLEDYTSYFNKLKQSGYTVYMEERVAEGNYFVTLVNRSANNGAGIMLHIMYNAYAHASTQPLGEGTTLADMFTPTLRVISSTITDSASCVNHILPEKFLTKQSYQKVTDSKLTVVERPDGTGCYIYTLEDGSFVVIDGGNNEYISEFYGVLKALYKEIYGTNPTSSKPIRIAAWYLTHTHGDHVGVLNGFSSYFGTDVVLDGIIGNFPSYDEFYNAPSVNPTILNKMGTTSWFKGTSEGSSAYVPFYNVHTGQKFYIGNLEFEVMFTPEDMHPWSVKAFNNACTVIRLTTHAHDVQVGGTVSANAVASSKVSLMSLGDIYAHSARMLRAAYGSYLESDIMTNGHHGTGGEGELYQLINPQIVLWQNSASAVKSKTSNSTDRYNVENLEMIKNTRWRYILSSYRLSSGTYNPTIIFKATGVAGLGAATTDAEVRAQAQAFVAGLQNVNSQSTIAYGTNYFVGYDFSTNKAATTYSGQGYLVWRGNYFSDTKLPE